MGIALSQSEENGYDFTYALPTMATIRSAEQELNQLIEFFGRPDAPFYAEKLPYMLRKSKEFVSNFPQPGSERLNGLELLEFLKLEKRVNDFTKMNVTIPDALSHLILKPIKSTSKALSA